MLDWINQIVIGTILGGSSLVKPKKGRNCYLIMRSSNRQWIDYKANELEKFGTKEYSYTGKSIRWRSECSKFLTDIYNQLYVDNTKIVSMNILDQLRDIGLAIWFIDKGYIKKGTFFLNVNFFDNQSQKTIENYFNEVNLSCTLFKHRKSTRLKFTKESSKKFLMVIGEKLPEFVLNKISLN